jgi:hypothetical protein
MPADTRTGSTLVAAGHAENSLITVVILPARSSLQSLQRWANRYKLLTACLSHEDADIISQFSLDDGVGCRAILQLRCTFHGYDSLKMRSAAAIDGFSKHAESKYLTRPLRHNDRGSDAEIKRLIGQSHVPGLAFVERSFPLVPSVRPVAFQQAGRLGRN